MCCDVVGECVWKGDVWIEEFEVVWVYGVYGVCFE